MRVLVQEWMESEAGWGKRPDGFSIHFSQEQRDDYITEYWEKENARNIADANVPDEYSYETGSPFWAEIIDDSEEMVKRALTRESFRTFEKNPTWLRRENDEH